MWKHPWRSVTFSKVAGFSLPYLVLVYFIVEVKSNTDPSKFLNLKNFLKELQKFEHLQKKKRMSKTLVDQFISIPVLSGQVIFYRALYSATCNIGWFKMFWVIFKGECHNGLSALNFFDNLGRYCVDMNFCAQPFRSTTI